MGKPLLEILGLDVFYGDAQAVWDVSFKVDESAIVALVGANGAGKSTILSTISGVLRPQRGDIFFQGESILGFRPEKVVTIGISHVPEGRRLFAGLTVLENLELGAFPARTRPHLNESLERAFHLFPILKNRMGQSAGSLSGGEQQMLAIARGMMARPSLIMLDEPSMGLAPVIVKLMFEIIQVLNKEGATVLLVEQNVHQTLEIANHIYVLQTGRLTMEGGGRELMNDPAFQQAYLGAIG